MPDFTADKRHPTAVTTKQGGVSLGREVMALRYDLVYEVLLGMVGEIDRQVKSDGDRGREKLVGLLSNMQVALEQALSTAASVAAFCEPWISAERSGLVAGAAGASMQQDALAALIGAHPGHPFNVGRVDDMESGVNALVVNSNGDGELSVRIVEPDRGRSSMVTFGDGEKGRSPETCAALVGLMQAMARDNVQTPSLAHCSPAA